MAAPIADEPQVKAAASALEVPLGQPFIVFVTASAAPAVAELNLRGSIDLGPAFEVVREVSTVRRDRDGMVVHEFELEVMPWQVGELQLPPIEVVWAAKGVARSVYTEPLGIRVVSFVGEGSEELRPRAPPISWLRRDRTMMLVIGVGAAAVALAAVVLWWRARQRRRPSAVVVAADAAVEHSAETEALARLEALATSGALQRPDSRAGYAELSEIMRRYLGRRFGFAVTDQTTPELKNQLLVLAPEHAERLARWLEHCDLVKFAAAQPAAEESHAMLTQAQTIIQQTRPTPGDRGG